MAQLNALSLTGGHGENRGLDREKPGP